ncbi:dynein regulatory complex protein 9-like [Homarus americanus]|uniref:dynein regulatory complex protein 9-like n=1 Tax=Homarus americanus TaxID=6706 RepID=UPI001C466FB1|nr:dynein regulatory complex protein 9-like [Homarus americanus]
MTLEHNTGIKFSRISRKTALRLGVIRKLLPGCPHKPANVDEDEFTENINDKRGHDLALKKLHDDIDFIEKVLCDLADELADKQSFTCLEKFIVFEKDDHKKKADFIALLQGQKWKAKHFKKSNRLHGLQKDLRHVKQDTHKVIQAKDQEIANLLTAINDAKRLNPKREAYEKKVAKVQIENLQFRIEQEEQSICKEIAKVGREIPQEIRVHDALTAFLKESCAKLETRILEWKEKFNVDTQRKKEEVAKWQAEVQSKKKDLNEVIQKYDEYWGVVREYEAEQEIERLRKEEEELHYRAASKIQAWWKGCMVRRGMSSGIKKKNKKNKPLKK